MIRRTAADAARGTVCDELVEVDRLVPTFLREPRRRSGRAVAPARRPLAGAVAAMARAPTDGAASPSANTTIRCNHSRPSSASSRAMRACSWWRTSAGSTSTPWVSGRCCTTSPPTPTSSATSAPTRQFEAERAAPDGGPQCLGPAPVPAHDPIRAADARPARQVAATRHPDRRVGRERCRPTSCGAAIWATGTCEPKCGGP